jgi:hypothetical protein
MRRKRVYDFVLPALNANGEELNNTVISIEINDQPGDAV